MSVNRIALVFSISVLAAAMVQAGRAGTVTLLTPVLLSQSYNDYMRDYHHNVGPPAPWQTLASIPPIGPSL